MPAWVPNGSGTTSVDFHDTGGGGASPSPIYHPTASGDGTGAAGGVAAPADPNLGTASLNALDPAGSVKQGGQQLGDMFAGLRDGLFGTPLSDSPAHVGGLPILADVASAISQTPGLGAAVKAAGDVVGGLGDTLKNSADVAGFAAEHLPSPDQMLTGGAGDQHVLEQKFQNPEVQAWLDEKNFEDPTKTNRDVYGQSDNGVFGTGLASNKGHMMNTVLREFAKQNNAKDPHLNPGAFETPGSLADTVTLVLNDTLGLANQVYQRALLGVGDNLEHERQIGAGEAVNTGFLGTNTDLPIIGRGSPNATPAEQLVAAKMANGSWTPAQAADFLVASGNAAHDPGLNVALATADPTLAASFGAGAIAKLGEKGIALGRVIEEGDTMVASAEQALEAANAAKVAAKASGAVGKELRAASKVIREAKSDLQVAQEARASLTEGRVASTTAAIGQKYAGLEGTMMGRVAKTTRFIIDPMHAIDLRLPGTARVVDLLSDATTRQLSKTMGDIPYAGLMDHMGTLDETGTIKNQYAKDIAVASTNRARAGLLSMHQASAVLKGLGGKLAGTGAEGREEVITNAANAVKERDLLKWLRQDYTSHVLQVDWTEADHVSLAKSLEARYGIPKEQWLEDFKGMNKEQKSLLKFAAYGGHNSDLIAAKAKAIADKHPSVAMQFSDGAGLERLVLLSDKTLSRVGGASLLSKLKAAKSTRKQVNLIREWQAKYPELLYIPIDAKNPGKSVQSMMDWLDKHMEGLPMQVKADELKQMHPAYQDLAGEMSGSGYSLGFRPKDEFLWGIERSNLAGGEYIAKREPWADHVGAADAGMGYRPGHHIPVNIAGMPIIGAPAQKVVKIADYMAAGARMLGAQVSGEQVATVAQKRFVSIENRGRLAEAGVTQQVAQEWWDRLQAYTREHQGYSGPRGFGKGDLYNALAKENLIPQTALNGSVVAQPEDILRMVLNAYDGDMRYIGLTQKLSGRAKKTLSAITGYSSNYAGQIAEHAWPTLKFSYNPLFQLQEKIEPIVLSSQRGITPALRSAVGKGGMSEADRATERLLQRMTDQSIVRMADIDQFEYSMYALFGKRMENLAKSPGSKMAKLQSAAGAFMDVQGVKRVNMVRTFRHGLGNEMKSVWEEVEPGAWDQMYAHAAAKYGRRGGHLLTEDEFAVQVMSENLLGNDIKVARKGTGGYDILSADWSNAIKTGEWYRPTHLGELKALDLEHVAASFNVMNNGRRIDNLAGLRRYVAEDNTRVGEVSDYLRRVGADPDYIARVENALTFSWEGFWHAAAKRFNLTSKESIALQDMFGEAAHLRGMSPVDFISQVYSPGIMDGMEGMIGSLDKPLGILRRGKDVPGKSLEGMTRGTFATHFDTLQARVHAAEKVSDPATWTEAEKAAYAAGDYKKFSKLRGYTAQEYGDWAEHQRLMGLAHPDALTGIVDQTTGGVSGADLFDLAAKDTVTPGPVISKGRSVLAGKEGFSTREDLVRQMSAVFSQHLDPSAKRALLLEFKPELRDMVANNVIRLDAADVHAMWDAGAEGKLADRILGYMDGKPGTGAFDAIKDEARGSKALRAGAEKYMTDHGVTPLGGPVRHYKVDDAHYETVADQYGALPEVPYDKTGRRPMTKQVYAADLDLKPQPAGVDDRTYKAYQQFVHETRDQFDHMTAPKSKGGMGIEVIVAKGDPYTADAAGRAAMAADLKKGRIRVKGTDSDHPLMTNEQNVMFRAVHDVFGHAANGFEFGPRGELNAAATHFQMYGPEARGPLLTETHGQTAYVNYSNDVFNPEVATGRPPALDPADPVGSFEKMHSYRIPQTQQEERFRLDSLLADPDVPPELKSELRARNYVNFRAGALRVPANEGVVRIAQKGEPGVRADVYMRYDKLVGDGIRALPANQQMDILQGVSDLMHEFPDLDIHHIDIGDFTGATPEMLAHGRVSKYGLGKYSIADGITYGGDDNEAVIILNKNNYGANYEKRLQEMKNVNESFAKAPHRGNVQVLDEHGDPVWDAQGYPTYRQLPRKSVVGTPFNVGTGPAHVMRHEAGHALDLMLRPRTSTGIDAFGKAFASHTRLAAHADYYDAVARIEKMPGAREWLSEYAHTSSQEFAAELFSKVTDPNLDMAALPERLRPAVEQYRAALIDGGYWKPTAAIDPVTEAMRGKTIRELNAAKRGTVYAPQKAGLLPQETIDEFANKFVGIGKHVEVNPDVARTAQEFGKFSTNAIFNGLMRGDNAVHADLLHNVAGIPTHAAVPYNYTEGMAHQLAVDAMKSKFDDAFRLQYFARDRSMLERSINHPMFGMYPASYMWGKLAPEMVQFIAQRPFGIRTGGMLSAGMRAQSAIALRREYDPEFDAQMEKMGHSQAIGFLGYLLPTIPWDIGASAPIWMKDIAQQGARNQRAVATGQPVEGFNVVKPVTDSLGKLNPLEQNIAWAGRAVDEANGANTPTEQRVAAVDAAGPTTAANISPVLASVLAELKAALSK